MVKRATTANRSAASELAAKLKVITDAAPGLRQAGVTEATIGADQIKLADWPLEVPKGTGEEDEPEFTLDSLRGGPRPSPAGRDGKGGDR